MRVLATVIIFTKNIVTVLNISEIKTNSSRVQKKVATACRGGQAVAGKSSNKAIRGDNRSEFSF